MWAWNAQITPSKIPFTNPPNQLTPVRRPDLDSDGEWRLGRARRLDHLDLAAGERQPNLCQLLLASERAQVGPVERRQRSPLLPFGEGARPRRERVAVAERILGAIGSRRHSGAELEADPLRPAILNESM